MNDFAVVTHRPIGRPADPLPSIRFYHSLVYINRAARDLLNSDYVTLLWSEDRRALLFAPAHKGDPNAYKISRGMVSARALRDIMETYNLIGPSFPATPHDDGLLIDLSTTTEG